MNYRHAFHAGNHADVLKHVALLLCLEALKRKDAPFGVLDTHAGRGQYDLFSAEAMRSPEWQNGIGKLWDWPEAPTAVAALLEAVRAHNADGALRYYPGSPLLIASAMRDDDVLDACELHPEDASALRRTVRGAGVRVHARDGWEAMGALLPPKQPRGLVLIDPPYEAPNELAYAAGAIGQTLTRFSHGVYLWWRPLKDESAIAAADAELRGAGAKNVVRADLWLDTPAREGALRGSSVLIANAPFGVAAALHAALPALATRLAPQTGGSRLTS